MGIILTPSVNSKTKDPAMRKLCTVIVRHISTKKQLLYFPNFHCSIACSYYSIWCLIIKSGPKIVKISNATFVNEIHRPFQRGFQKYNFLAREVLISGGATAAKKRQKSLELCKLESRQI